ncbi:MAG: CHAT domain-containing protein, partial [Saprospiraceae bacterium]|nr:CHAT domain-containing protein [Saprospiraceae bacterium]
GCPATVMSLWEVRDDATARLMESLLANLRKGMEKDEALLRAKRDYFQQAADPFPYFWAGFALTGSPEPVRRPIAPWLRYAALALACLLVVFLTVWRLRMGRK